MVEFRRRKKKNNKLILFAIIIAFILTTIGIFYTINKFRKAGNIENALTNSQDNFKGFYIGDRITRTGKIKLSDQLGVYTHILTSGSETIGLKSKNLDLSIYSGDVQILGVIEDIKDSIPVVDVQEIISQETVAESSTESENTGESLQKNQTFFDFPMYGFYVDFISNTGFKVDIDDDKIIIKQSAVNSGDTDLTLGEISVFNCISGDSVKDCTSMEKRFKELGMETFVSTNLIKFYKRPESTNRFFTNGNLWGYNLTAKSDSDVIKLSKYIYNYSQNTIKDKLTKAAPTICKDKQTNLKTVSSIKLETQEEKLIANIEGTDTLENKVSCSINAKVGKSVSGTLIEYKITSKSNKVLTGDVTTGTITTGTTESSLTTGTITTDTTLTSENTTTLLSGSVNTGNMLERISKNGFSVYLPKSVSFKKVELSGDLQDWQKDLKCSYKLNIINYKLKDQLLTSPSLEIYYCNGGDSETQSVANSNNLEYKKSMVNGKNVLIKYNDDASKTIGEKVIVY